MLLRRTVGVLAAIACLGALAVPAEAQTDLDLTISPFVSGTFFLSDLPETIALGRVDDAPLEVSAASMTDAFGAGLNVGLMFNERFSVEATFGWSRSEFEAAGLSNVVDVDGYMYGANILYHINADPNVKPFFGVGAGAETMDFTDSTLKKDTRFMGDVLVGANISFNDRSGLRIEARNCMSSFDSNIEAIDQKFQNNLMLSLGLAFIVPIGS